MTEGKNVSFSIGEVVTIKGAPFKLMHVNEGKRRLTFTPIGTEEAEARSGMEKNAEAVRTAIRSFYAGVDKRNAERRRG
jgi:hypothetical protein